MAYTKLEEVTKRYWRPGIVENEDWTFAIFVKQQQSLLVSYILFVDQ